MRYRQLAAAGWLPIGIVLIVVLSGNLPSHTSASGSPGPRSLDATLGPSGAVLPPTLSGATNVSLVVGRSSVNLSDQFWGTTVNNEVRTFSGETNAVNATPARVLVWPGAMAGEDYDPLTNTHYNTYNGTPTRALTNESQFVTMCKATHCTAVVQVPAEIDDAKIAAAIVNYTEVNLSFRPAYWMIGNEPELWGHWQVAWKNWGTTYTNGPDPTQFGQEVLAYVKAIRAIDNTTPILGLPASGCTCGLYSFDQWIAGVLKVTGSKIQAVAFHEYPAGWLGTGDGSLHDFYSTIQSDAGIPVRMIAARAAVQSSCPACNVSVWISELGAALSWSYYGQYSFGLSGALSIASQITQAMDYNLSNVDLFATELATSNSWFGTNGLPRPDYALYTQIFDHLGTQAFPVNLTGLDSTLYGIDTIAPNDLGRRDLLVVNDNITHAVSFSPKFAEGSVNAPVEAWSWNGSIHVTAANYTTWVEPYTPNPVPAMFAGGLPSSYTLPPQSLVLFESYPSGGTYVRLGEQGVPSPTPWYASVGSRFYTTSADNLSLLLPTGAYPVSSIGIPLPIGGKERVPSERLGAFVPSPLLVSGAYTNGTLVFAPQWRVNVTAFPAEGGVVTPDVGWWNASQRLNLTVVAPAPGYAFVGWSGWGPGNVSGPNRSISVVPTGRLIEKARFVVGQQVVLAQTGLPVGTPWSVTVRGFTTNTTGNSLSVYEPMGRFAFDVAPMPGYRIIPARGAFTVASSWTLVHIRFVPITPPGLEFPVTFRASGLPSSDKVAITVRGASQTLGTLAPAFDLINGSYAYSVGYVAGYHAAAPAKTFNVSGAPLTIVVPFVRTVYHVTWMANGTREGLNWTVALNGTPMAATSAWVSTVVPNGSYSYAVSLPANFTASPRTGSFQVGGFGITFPLNITLLTFRTWFEATGPAAASDWSIRFGNRTQVASAAQSSFLAPNGTYTFDVHPPAGYFAVPSHGNLTVAGPTAPTVIRFEPTSTRPSAALVAALSSGALWTAFWIGGSVVVGFAAFRSFRRRDG